MNARRETPTGSRAGGASGNSCDRDRDQEESAFATILGALVARASGAEAAAIVDTEGETVDYAGNGDPFGLRVTAAHWRIVLRQGDAQKSLGRLQWLAVRNARRSYLVHALPQGYALVVAFTRATRLMGWEHAVATCVRAICEEAGWVSAQTEGLDATTVAAGKPDRSKETMQTTPSRPRDGWFRVDIIADERRRPTSIRVGDRLYPLEILGSIVGRADAAACAPGLGSTRSARAWRVRLEKGVEATVIRTADGTWCADEPVDLLQRPKNSIHARESEEKPGKPGQARG
jgi:hypothetical protein